jgi:two-component system, chemotaxis family, sensor kinase CheA
MTKTTQTPSEIEILRGELATLTDLLAVHEEQSRAQFALIRQQRVDLAKLLANEQAAYAAVQRLLNSVDQGFATLDRAGALLSGRSAVFDRWFGAPTDGMRFAECLRRVDATTAAMFELAWGQIEDEFLPLELLIEQLPAKARFGDRYVSIVYKPALDGAGRLANLLVVITDVTAQVERERAEAHQRDLLSLMARFFSDRTGFHDFLREAEVLVRSITASAIEPAELKRAVHTLKGTCAQFGAQVVATHCHEFETQLAELSEIPSELERRTLGAVWGSLRDRIAVFLRDDRDAITVERGEFERLRELARATSASALSRILDTWTWEPAARRLARLADQAQALARRLGKGNIEVAVDAGDLRFEPGRWTPFWTAAVHLVANSVDHGLEPPERRAALGKLERPRLALRCFLAGDSVVFDFADNGRGIDWSAVARKAAERGLDASSQHALSRALFVDGFTTRDEVTLSSGRGVGLAAVRAACEVLGGTFAVESAANRGTVLRFTLPAEGVANGAAAATTADEPAQRAV